MKKLLNTEVPLSLVVVFLFAMAAAVVMAIWMFRVISGYDITLPTGQDRRIVFLRQLARAQ